MPESIGEKVARQGALNWEYKAMQSRKRLEKQSGGGGGSSGSSGCGCGGLLLVIVLVVVGITVYHIWQQRHGPDRGLVKEQTVTLTSGSDYALTASGDLKPVSGTTGYFVRVTGAGLSFPARVPADTAPTWAPEYNDACEDLDLPGRGAASFPWKKLGLGTQLCAEPQGRADPYDYFMTVKGLTAGHQVQLDIITWDTAKIVPNN
jgi:hypothetical protein